MNPRMFQRVAFTGCYFSRSSGQTMFLLAWFEKWMSGHKTGGELFSGRPPFSAVQSSATIFLTTLGVSSSSAPRGRSGTPRLTAFAALYGIRWKRCFRPPSGRRHPSSPALPSHRAGFSAFGLPSRLVATALCSGPAACAARALPICRFREAYPEALPRPGVLRRCASDPAASALHLRFMPCRLGLAYRRGRSHSQPLALKQTVRHTARDSRRR